MSKRSPHFLYIFAQALDFLFELFQFKHPDQLLWFIFSSNLFYMDSDNAPIYYNRKRAVVKVFYGDSSHIFDM